MPFCGDRFGRPIDGLGMIGQFFLEKARGAPGMSLYEAGGVLWNDR